MSTKRFFGFLALSLALIPAQIPAQTAARTWDFESQSPGPAGAPFAAAAGEWRVQTAAAPPSGRNVMAQVAKNARPVFNVLLVNDTNHADLDLSVRLHSVAGEIDQGGGLVWRARDAQNYYIARYNPLEDNFRVYKVVAGTRTQLQSADVSRRDGWRTLRIVMKGEAIECYLDGMKLLEARDSTFTGAGKIGLWTKADAQTLFDDLTVSSGKP